MAELKLTDLTTEVLSGTGAFDALMRAFNLHIESQFKANRIVGADYAKVYLSGVDTVMNKALEFIMRKQEIDLQAQLLAQQIILAGVEVEKARATVELVKQQTLNAIAEGALLVANQAKIDAEIRHLDGQTANLPKTGALITAQKDQVTQQTANTAAELVNIPKQGLILDAQKLQIEAQRGLVLQQTANGILEGKVLVAQECKLRADYDLTMGTTIKTATENLLLSAKVATEKAQTQGAGTDPDSVIGKQKSLYQAQTDGFKRDAEQKAAKIMVDSWNARRMTDDATVADGTNRLNDATIGQTVSTMLAGIGA